MGRADPRPFAWVTLDRRHDDPRSCCGPWRERSTPPRPRPPTGASCSCSTTSTGCTRPPRATRSPRSPPTCRTTITVALASRSELPLPVARLRAQGLVTELRHDELAMTRTEAATLLRRRGLHLDGDDVDALLHRTEGWPAGLSLAALSLADQPAPAGRSRASAGSTGSSPSICATRCSRRSSEDERRFVLRSSVLDMLTAPACDAVLAAPRRGRHARAAAAVGLPARRARPHGRAPSPSPSARRPAAGRAAPRPSRSCEAALHRRASAWYAREGDRDRALRHALAADEVERAGDLVWDGVPSTSNRARARPSSTG